MGLALSIPQPANCFNYFLLIQKISYPGQLSYETLRCEKTGQQGWTSPAKGSQVHMMMLFGVTSVSFYSVNFLLMYPSKKRQIQGTSTVAALIMQMQIKPRVRYNKGNF